MDLEIQIEITTDSVYLKHGTTDMYLTADEVKRFAELRAEIQEHAERTADLMERIATRYAVTESTVYALQAG